MVTESHGHFILDVSAFTKGLGNIKKWIESGHYNMEIFIPFYTIHELDYSKKGTSVIATNARESIRLIEQIVSNEDDHGHGNSNAPSAKLILETSNQTSPNWKTCSKYKTRAPKVSEFKPNYNRPDPNLIIQSESKAVLFSNAAASANGSNNNGNDRNGGFIGSGNSLNSNMTQETIDDQTKAKVPNRLKYLLKPCIKKIKIDKEDWKLITEDPVVKIWCEAYGIKCMNITQAESYLFNNKFDIATNPSNEINLKVLGEHNNNNNNNNHIADNVNNGNNQKYNGNHKSKHARNKKKKKQDGFNSSNNGSSALQNTLSHDSSSSSNSVVVESFGTMSYAPRGTGQLWVP